MFQSESIKNIANALVQFAATVEQPAKNATNPHFRNRYADLHAIIEATKAPLAACGLVTTQATRFEDGLVLLRSTVIHAESGEWIASDYPVIPVKSDPQGYGSALTYARRYNLSALLGIAADEDDDGNAASGKAAKPATKKTTRKPAAKKTPAQPKPAAKAPAAPAPQPAPVAKVEPEIEDLDDALPGEPVAPPADNPGDFLITIGKNSKPTPKKLAEVSPKFVAWYANELAPTTPEAEALQKAAQAYLATLETA